MLHHHGVDVGVGQFEALDLVSPTGSPELMSTGLAYQQPLQPGPAIFYCQGEFRACSLECCNR